MNAMQDRLLKDARSWSKERASSSLRRDEPAASPAMKPAKRPRKAAVETKPAVKPAGEPKKGFSMSYDGVTTAEHITHMINRGRR